MNDAHCDVRLSAHEPVRYERFTTAEADAIADLRGSPVLHGLEAQVAVVIGHDRADDRQAEARSRDGRLDRVGCEEEAGGQGALILLRDANPGIGNRQHG